MTISFAPRHFSYSLSTATKQSSLRTALNCKTPGWWNLFPGDCSEQLSLWHYAASGWGDKSEPLTQMLDEQYVPASSEESNSNTVSSYRPLFPGLETVFAMSFLLDCPIRSVPVLCRHDQSQKKISLWSIQPSQWAGGSPVVKSKLLGWRPAEMTLAVCSNLKDSMMTLWFIWGLGSALRAPLSSSRARSPQPSTRGTHRCSSQLQRALLSLWPRPKLSGATGMRPSAQSWYLGDWSPSSTKALFKSQPQEGVALTENTNGLSDTGLPSECSSRTECSGWELSRSQAAPVTWQPALENKGKIHSSKTK